MEEASNVVCCTWFDLVVRLKQRWRGGRELYFQYAFRMLAMRVKTLGWGGRAGQGRAAQGRSCVAMTKRLALSPDLTAPLPSLPSPPLSSTPRLSLPVR